VLVENEAMILHTASSSWLDGVRLLRAGAFKPGAAPTPSRDGPGGVAILDKLAAGGPGLARNGIDGHDNADAVAQAADVIQIGTRNMQNFSLLKRVALASKPCCSSAACRRRSRSG